MYWPALVDYYHLPKREIEEMLPAEITRLCRRLDAVNKAAEKAKREAEKPHG